MTLPTAQARPSGEERGGEDEQDRGVGECGFERRGQVAQQMEFVQGRGVGGVEGRLAEPCFRKERAGHEPRRRDGRGEQSERVQACEPFGAKLS